MHVKNIFQPFTFKDDFASLLSNKIWHLSFIFIDYNLYYNVLFIIFELIQNILLIKRYVCTEQSHHALLREKNKE